MKIKKSIELLTELHFRATGIWDVTCHAKSYSVRPICHPTGHKTSGHTRQATLPLKMHYGERSSAPCVVLNTAI